MKQGVMRELNRSSKAPSAQGWRKGVLPLLVSVALLGTDAMHSEVKAEALSPETVARIDAIIANRMEAAPFPGLAIAIERKGEVVYAKGFGKADLEQDVPVTVDTVFPIGSITKSFTGLALAQLVVDGKVSIEETAGHYLPDLPEPARSVKVRNLLNHTGGLVNYTDLPEFPYNARKEFTREEMVGYFASKPLMFKPGTAWSYSNSGTYLVGLIIEKVSGVTYDEYVRTHILEPFGMSKSLYSDWTRLIPNRAHGYKKGKNGWQNALQYDPTVPFSAGAIMSTVGDLLKYRRGVFASDKTSQAVRDVILKHDKLADGTEIMYTLGCLGETRFEGHRKIAHAGDIYGFSANYAYYPDDDLVIVITTNNQGGAFPPLSVEQKIAREMLGVPQPVVKSLPVPADLAANVSGDYYFAPYRFGPEVHGFSFKDGQLYLNFGGTKSGGPALPLLYQGAGRFVSVVDDEHNVVFKPGKRGKPATLTMQYYGGTFSAQQVDAK